MYEASSGGRVYVGGFAGAEDRYGLRNAHVGLVVSVLGRDQKHPVVPKGIRHFRFNCDRFEDRTQWCELVEAMMEELDAGRSVLVHCMAGVHRAPMCAAGALAVLLGISLRDAYGYVLASGRYVDPHTFEQRRRRCWRHPCLVGGAGGDAPGGITPEWNARHHRDDGADSGSVRGSCGGACCKSSCELDDALVLVRGQSRPSL